MMTECYASVEYARVVYGSPTEAARGQRLRDVYIGARPMAWRYATPVVVATA